MKDNKKEPEKQELLFTAIIEMPVKAESMLDAIRIVDEKLSAQRFEIVLVEK